MKYLVSSKTSDSSVLSDFFSTISSTARALLRRTF